MRPGVNFLVMRRGPLIGRDLTTRKIVSVAGYTTTLPDALDIARAFLRAQTPVRRAVYWIAKFGTPAHRTKKRRGGRRRRR